MTAEIAAGVTGNVTAHAITAPPGSPRRALVDASGLITAGLVLSLILLAALRGNTRDTENYIAVFKTVTAFPADPVTFYADFAMEWFFGLASWATRGLALPVQAVFLIYSALTFLCLRRAANCCGLSLAAVLPYYLGSFFILQQLMQMRQGLAVPFAFMLLLMVATGPSPRRFPWGGAVVTLAFHIVSVLPLLGGYAVSRIGTGTSGASFRRRAALVFAGVLAAAILVSSLEVVALFDRLAQYANDPDYGVARSPLDIANIRAALLCGLFLLAEREVPAGVRQPYRLLVILYVAHLAVRIGFINVAILSGRLSTAFSFAEVFLMPLTVAALVGPGRRWLVGGFYLAVHTAATLLLQADYVIADYARPLPL